MGGNDSMSACIAFIAGIRFTGMGRTGKGAVKNMGMIFDAHEHSG